eukprot:TRINITY_DN12_c0_g1_i1.p1 TRINITY_DN12_c0_g1~~TRINITY_DN12_c0_g1_i1.p1  ORF type:complete len:308 (-),score=45.04 TRINITY_DN12_c0_g1_i1:2012-2935(-)
MIVILIALFSVLCIVDSQTISLPPGIQVEGVEHAAGTLFFAAQFRQGGVLLVDTATGFTTTVVPPAFDRRAAGLAHRNNTLYVAGAGSFRVPPRMFVYDVLTGESIASCNTPMGGLVNDVAVDDSFAYFTDSFLGNIYALPVGSLTCDFDIIELPRDAFPQGGRGFGANGIVKFASGLIVANTAMGSLFFVDIASRNASQLLPTGAVAGVDGLELHDESVDGTQATLYVVQNSMELISAWQTSVEDERVSLQSVPNTTSSLLDRPPTIAIVRGKLVMVNTQFGDFPPTEELPADAQFDLVALRIDSG